jgi:1,2-phenylacetyl-CoA epoxidase PaaB subunit
MDLGPVDRRRPRRAASLGAFRLKRYTRVHSDVHEYDVFARKTRVEPLHQVGSVVAPDDDLAMAYARATYDEERWVEMMIVPKAAVISLWAPGGDS